MPQSSVLIIDADKTYADALALAFRDAGVQVHQAADGHLGMQMAFRLYPSLIVLAVELPVLSGYSVCKKLKHTQQTADIPLVLISSTASAETFEQHQRLRTRAEHYLRKPIEPADVLYETREHLPELGGAPADQKATGKFTALSRELEAAFEAFLPEGDDAEGGESWGELSAPTPEPTPTPAPPDRRTRDLPVVPRAAAAAAAALQRPAALADERAGETNSGQPARGSNDYRTLVPREASGSLRLEVNILMAQIERQEAITRTLQRSLQEANARGEDLRQRLDAQVQQHQRAEQRLVERDDEVAQLRKENDELRERASSTPAASDSPEPATLEQERATARSAEQALRLLQERWDALDARASALDGELASQREAWRQEREAMAEIQQRLSEMVAELEQRAEAARVERDELLRSLERAEARAAEDREAIEHLQRAGEEAHTRIDDLEAQLHERASEAERLEVEVTTSRQRLLTAEGYLGRLDGLLTEQHNRAHERHQALQSAFEALTAAHSLALDNLRSVSGHAETLEERLFMASEVLSRVAALVEQVTGSIDTNRDELQLPDAPELEPLPQITFPSLPPEPEAPTPGAWRSWASDTPTDETPTDEAPADEAPAEDAAASSEEPTPEDTTAEPPPAAEAPPEEPAAPDEAPALEELPLAAASDDGFESIDVDMSEVSDPLTASPDADPAAFSDDEEMEDVGPISTLHIPPPTDGDEPIEMLGENMLLDDLPEDGLSEADLPEDDLLEGLDAGVSAELMMMGEPVEPEPAPEEPISGSLKAAEDELDNALELFAFDALLEDGLSKT